MKPQGELQCSGLVSLPAQRRGRALDEVWLLRDVSEVWNPLCPFPGWVCLPRSAPALECPGRRWAQQGSWHIPGTAALPAAGGGVPVYILQSVLCL